MPNCARLKSREKCPSVRHVLCLHYVTHQFGPRLMNEEAHGQVEMCSENNSENDTALTNMKKRLPKWIKEQWKGFPWAKFSKLYLCWQPASFSSPVVGYVFPTSGTHQQVVSHHLPCTVPLGLDIDLFSIETSHTKPYPSPSFVCDHVTLACDYYLCLGGLSSFVHWWLESGKGYLPCTLKSTHTPPTPPKLYM